MHSFKYLVNTVLGSGHSSVNRTEKKPFPQDYILVIMIKIGNKQNKSNMHGMLDIIISKEDKIKPWEEDKTSGSREGSIKS